ncbi:hypothetical protein FHR83_001545 [Actinoplanes campanulatus]|uniref:Integral membrane protein n=1 Tax=Actinoplanes campanulatus TaxID=113559 RepID=A0A7W5FD37_9ACTN|nr:hypothetical protein [Actinoplanes campanulatus]GGN33875.1 hypothetical protein GCM10010109_56340 [Actinoplanes campanulatus]GID38409.1 hypothetical protein Aca09nite_49150 [Actinoplanes campanulatus]
MSALASFRVVEALRLILLFIHLVGFALLLGGAITQFLSGKFRINPAILWGSIIQLASGIALSAPLRGGGDDEPDPVKLGVKLLLAVMIFIMVFIPRKRDEVNKGHFIGIITLTLVNAAVAVFWH